MRTSARASALAACLALLALAPTARAASGPVFARFRVEVSATTEVTNHQDLLTPCGVDEEIEVVHDATAGDRVELVYPDVWVPLHAGDVKRQQAAWGQLDGRQSEGRVLSFHSHARLQGTTTVVSEPCRARPYDDHAHLALSRRPDRTFWQYYSAAVTDHPLIRFRFPIGGIVPGHFPDPGEPFNPISVEDQLPNLAYEPASWTSFAGVAVALGKLTAITHRHRATVRLPFAKSSGCKIGSHDGLGLTVYSWQACEERVALDFTLHFQRLGWIGA